MTNDLIEKFVENKTRKNKHVNIHFKQISVITGLFIQTDDYQELKGNNFWRIVAESKLEQWEKTKDLSLARIFNGAEFTRLSDD